MKKLIAIIALIATSMLLAPIADAGHPQRRIAGYNHCGTAIYDTLRCIGHDRCGRPVVHRWVRERYPSGCTRPGRCNYHGHQQRIQRSRISSASIRSSQTHYVTPRVTIRSSFVRPGIPSRSSFTRSSSRSQRSCR